MSLYIPITCDHCRRTLNVRPAYLGRWVNCNHCEHAFIAREVKATAHAASAAEPAIVDVSTVEEAERLATALESTRSENARLIATVEALKTELADRLGEVEQLRRSAEDLVTVRAERDQEEAQRREAIALAEQLRMQLEDVQRFCDEVKTRYETASLDHSRQHEESLRHWEAERRVLVARWEEELRLAREESAKKHGEEWAAAQARQQLLHDQLEEARRQFEQENHALRGEIDVLQSEFSSICAERQARQPAGPALQHEGELRAPVQVVEDELDLVRLEAPVAATGESDALDHQREPLEARRCEDRASEHEVERSGQIQGLSVEINHERQGNHEQSTTLAHELEAMFQVQLAVELERANAAVDSLRNEVLSSQETVQRLQQERDAAIEKMGIVRFDRDQLHDSHTHLVARLQEVEEYHHATVERLLLEVAEARRQADTAINRQAFKSIPHQILSPRIDREPQETPGELPFIPEPEATVLVEPTVEPESAATTDSVAPDPSDLPDVVADPVQDSDPTPEPPDLTTHHALEVTETRVETNPPPKSVVTVPLAVGSPEDRIQSLRNYLRVVHEAGSKEHMCRPLFARLTRIWKK